MLRTCLALALLTTVAGCGDDDDDTVVADADVSIDAADTTPDAPPAGPGLLIEGTLIVENVVNSEVNANHRVNATIRITRDGAPVTNAIIRVNPPGAFETFLTGEALDPSLYTGNYMNYTLPNARIEIGADDDDIPQTVIVGMELFKITDPLPGASVVETDDLSVAWSRPGSAATSLLLVTDGGYDSGELADAASHVIPASALSIETADDEVRVLRCRRNESLPGDAADGSYVDFCVRSYLSFTVTK
jgi:hypothetical protein